jgi:hypothetical protein
VNNPKEVEERIERFNNGWRTLAPDKSFGGMTLAQFEAACAPSLAARARVDGLQVQLREAMSQRDEADDNTVAKMQLVAAGVIADPTEGDDSPLYKALGYTPRSERKTGLTRKRKEPAGSKA